VVHAAQGSCQHRLLAKARILGTQRLFDALIRDAFVSFPLAVLSESAWSFDGLGYPFPLSFSTGRASLGSSASGHGFIVLAL